ncbi:hypothetical protein [Olleya sp. YS]|uniref:hypothetical protein n=1 Tax=Olleya sp. YS TaxID=3028318 RepID=UPI002434366A|nr:hypothetical protein [Olleya sp. YS]WGD34929.1 hypothetical protein Ollyesu_00605 [Olleya sp. YS]
MKLFKILVLVLLIFSCQDDYKIISESDLKKLTIQDTLVNNPSHLIMTVGKSESDEFPKLLLKKRHMYMFDRDFEVANDSTIISYYSAFLIDSDGAFRKNGIWLYAQFKNEGVFPFNSNSIIYSVDSIPKNWNTKRPTTEGIYFYENDSLQLLSKEQSEEKFKEKRKNGFYFIPNKGRLFDKINVNDLE